MATVLATAAAKATISADARGLLGEVVAILSKAVDASVLLRAEPVPQVRAVNSGGYKAVAET